MRVNLQGGSSRLKRLHVGKSLHELGLTMEYRVKGSINAGLTMCSTIEERLVKEHGRELELRLGTQEILQCYSKGNLHATDLLDF